MHKFICALNLATTSSRSGRDLSKVYTVDRPTTISNERDQKLIKIIIGENGSVLFSRLDLLLFCVFFVSISKLTRGEHGLEKLKTLLTLNPIVFNIFESHSQNELI